MYIYIYIYTSSFYLVFQYLSCVFLVCLDFFVCVVLNNFCVFSLVSCFFLVTMLLFAHLKRVIGLLYAGLLYTVVKWHSNDAVLGVLYYFRGFNVVGKKYVLKLPLD